MNKSKIAGGLFFLISIGFFLLQFGYLYANWRLGIEYIDGGMFYIVNVTWAIFLALGIWLVFLPVKKWAWIGGGIIILFTIINAVLLSADNKEGKTITSISPDYNQILSIKVNSEKAEAIYYRPLYIIFAKPKDSFQLNPHADVKVEWLADDIGAVTFEKRDGSLQQFIATYGDRGGGISYYYVAAEIFGEWEGKNVKVVSNTNGISVTRNGKTETFGRESIKQFGTLAVVLSRGEEAVWTLSLNKNFVVQSNPTLPQPGEISLYKAAMDDHKPVVLRYKGLPAD